MFHGQRMSFTNSHRTAFDGKIHDDWAQPAAAYEMGVLAWMEVGQPGLKRLTTSSSSASKTDMDVWRRKKIGECQSWLDKCAGWGNYLLDARIGIRVQTGMDTLKWYKRTNGWSTS